MRKIKIKRSVDTDFTEAEREVKKLRGKLDRAKKSPIGYDKKAMKGYEQRYKETKEFLASKKAKSASTGRVKRKIKIKSPSVKKGVTSSVVKKVAPSVAKKTAGGVAKSVAKYGMKYGGGVAGAVASMLSTESLNVGEAEYLKKRGVVPPKKKIKLKRK